MVVEDDDLIRESLAELLSDEGYQVATATNGKEALDTLLPHTARRPCLIVLDLMMPVMNGWEFIAAKKSNLALSPIPVVVVSAAGERSRGVEAAAILNKPFDWRALLSLIQRYCNGSA